MTKELAESYDAVAACNRCGFCTSYCPTYNSSSLEGHSPRGRNQAFRSLIEGKLNDPKTAREFFDTCILCGECTSVCFSEVPTSNLMIQARDILNKKFGVSIGLKIIIKTILPNPILLRRFLKISFLAKSLGISWLLKKIGLLQRAAPSLAAADDLVPDVSIRFLLDHKISKNYKPSAIEADQQRVLVAHKKITQLKKDNKPVPADLVQASQRQARRPRLAYLPVCGSQYLKSSIGVSTFRLLKKLKFDFIAPEIVCCGLPAASYGMIDEVRKFARKNMKKIGMANFRYLIVDDSSCGAHFKDYPQYFEKGSDDYKNAEEFSGKVWELSSFLLEQGLIETLKTMEGGNKYVAYHDPCKAQYSQKIVSPPRKLLEAIPNLNVVPINDSDQCCGGGGTYSFMHPEMSKDIVRKKAENIINSGAQVVVTSSASCLIQISAGLRSLNSHIRPMHLAEFLASTLNDQ